MGSKTCDSSKTYFLASVDRWNFTCCLQFFCVEETVIVFSFAEVYFLGAACLAGELKKVSIGARGHDDVAAALAEIDAEDGGHLLVMSLELFSQH